MIPERAKKTIDPPDILWQQFTAAPSVPLKRALVLHYVDLVRFVVSRFNLHQQGKGQSLDRDDVVQFGILGLVDAIDKFSPTMGVKFETYAVPRIRGAILDELRKLDWVPRSVRANTQRRNQAAEQITQEQGRDAIDLEIAGRLAMTVPEYQKLVRETGMPGIDHTGPFSSDAEGTMDNVAEQAPGPLELLSDEESKAILIDAIGDLPARDRAVIALYYYEGLKLGEIGKVLRVSESRVSQIHAEILRSLRSKLTTME
jgi:RNA polymerase sigma factor for flagellar operon FliA